ncbi:MAG: DUF948 domain-containing protein [Cyanobacteria bacterium J06632_3]
MALLTVAIFTLQELARAARSAEKLLDTLNRELPQTLNDLRLTGKDLSGLSDEVSHSVQSARSVVEHVDKGITTAKVQAQKAHITTRSLFAGATAALRVLAGKPRRRRRPPTRRRPIGRPPASNTTVNTAKNAEKITGAKRVAPPANRTADAIKTVEELPVATPSDSKQLPEPKRQP